MAVNKVLCVDDSATDLAHIKQICRKAGYTVLTATSGQEALDLAEAEKPDAILLDVVMKPMNGFQTCRKLGKSNATKDIPVILVSSKGEETDKMWGQEQGADDYVVKPYEPSQITSALSRI